MGSQRRVQYHKYLHYSQLIQLSEICASDRGDYEEHYLLAYDTM
jgi:hypothetical protein